MPPFLPYVHTGREHTVPTNSETGKKEERREGYHLQREDGRYIQGSINPGIPQGVEGVTTRVYLRVSESVTHLGYTTGV